MDGALRLWLVERTYSDDELNLVILTYASPDGEVYKRMERALTSYSEGAEAPVSVDVEASDVASVDDPELRDRYSREARRMREEHEPDDVI